MRDFVVVVLHLGLVCPATDPVADGSADYCYCYSSQLAAVAQSILPCRGEAALDLFLDLVRREYIDLLGTTSGGRASGLFLLDIIFEILDC